MSDVIPLHPADNATVRRMIFMGNLMAWRLEQFADELDRSYGANPKRLERALANEWCRVLDELLDSLKPKSDSVGYCEGLCGGLLSHHLVDGLCPECRAHPAIRPLGARSGAERDARRAVQANTEGRQ